MIDDLQCQTVFSHVFDRLKHLLASMMNAISARSSGDSCERWFILASSKEAASEAPSRLTILLDRIEPRHRFVCAGQNPQHSYGSGWRA